MDKSENTTQDYKAISQKINLTENQHLTAMIDYIENQSEARLDALMKCSEAYAKAISEDPKFWREKTTTQVSDMLKGKKLEAWRRIQKNCLVLNRPEVKRRLLIAAEKLGIGSNRWVLEEPLL